MGGCAVEITRYEAAADADLCLLFSRLLRRRRITSTLVVNYDARRYSMFEMPLNYGAATTSSADS